MFVCNLCEGKNKNIPAINPKEVVNHLLITQNKDGVFHCHGPMNNPELIKQFIKVIAKEAKIPIEDEERVVN